mgnify:CR=1 FL=1
MRNIASALQNQRWGGIIDVGDDVTQAPRNRKCKFVGIYLVKLSLTLSSGYVLYCSNFQKMPNWEKRKETCHCLQLLSVWNIRVNLKIVFAVFRQHVQAPRKHRGMKYPCCYLSGVWFFCPRNNYIHYALLKLCWYFAYWSLPLKDTSSILHLLAESTPFIYKCRFSLNAMTLVPVLVSSLWNPALTNPLSCLPTLLYRNCTVVH